VLVLERNRRAGGILASVRREGFKMDFGSHLISRGEKGPLGRVLRQLDSRSPRFLTHPIPLRSRGMFAATAPERRSGLIRVAAEVARDLELPPREVAHLARLLFQIFTLTEPELRAWDRRTLADFIGQHTEHPAVYFLMSFMASIFFVLPPWRVSAGESIRCLRWLLRDYSLSYVEGGMDQLVRALLGFVRMRGGEVVLGAQVVRVTRGRRGWIAVTRDGREHEARAICCNLAPCDFLHLVDPRMLPPEWVARARAIVPSGNAHQLRIALRRPLIEEGCLIGGVSLDGLTLRDLSVGLMERAVADIDAGRISDPLAIYAPVPTNYDPSLAPPGRQLIIASIYGPTRPDPQEGVEAWRDRSLRALAQVVPGLFDEMLFSEFVPIPQVGRWMGKSGNGAISNGQVPGQVGRDRFPVDVPLPGLYVCGDGAGGRGIGTELAAESGIEAAEAIARELLLRPRREAA
jgi:prolycopene isomerase